MRVLLYTLLFTAALCALRAEDAPILCLDPGGHTATINKILFTPDGKQLISVGDDKVIRCWDTATGKALRTLRGQIGPGLDGMLYAVALSPDGHTLAVSGYPTRWGIRLIDLRTGKIIRLLHGHWDVVESLAFSPDGATLASGSQDATVRLWNVATGKCRRVLLGHTKEIYEVAFSPDGRQLASASFDQTARVWSVKTGATRFTLTGHTAEVDCLAWSPDGKTIATGSFDQTIRLWNAGNGRLRRMLPRQENNVTCLAFSPDSRRLVSGLGDGDGDCTARLWALPAGKLLRKFAKIQTTVMAVAFSPDGRTVACTGGWNNEIYLWSSATGVEQRRLVGRGATAYSVGWAPDGTRVAWGNQPDVNAPLEHTFDLRAGKAGTEVADGEDWQQFLAYHNELILAPSDDALSLSILKDGKETARIRQDDSFDGIIRCSTFTPAGEVVVGAVSTLALYDTGGKRLRQFLGHNGEVWAVAASPDGRYLASASTDETVRIWPLRTTGYTVAPLLTLFRATNGAWVAWTPEGYYACSPGAERFIVWQMNRGIGKAADYYPVSQFRHKLYRPDVIRRLLDAGSTAQAVQLADAARKKEAAPAR